MFIYIENDIESHRNTQNINIQHKIHQQHENTFSKVLNFQKIETNVYFQFLSSNTSAFFAYFHDPPLAGLKF